jgi:hypothetical protein
MKSKELSYPTSDTWAMGKNIAPLEQAAMKLGFCENRLSEQEDREIELCWIQVALLMLNWVGALG